MSQPIKNFQCPLCGRCFTQKSNAKKHQLSHKVWPEGITGTIPTNGHKSEYVCPFCSATVNSYTKLRTHLKQHSHCKTYMCVQPNCNVSCYDVASLLSHVKDSHAVPVYRCYLCSETFSSLSEISEHQFKHDTGEYSVKSKTDEKYVCDKCKRSFSNLEYLKHHQITVTHEYPCAECSKIFVSEHALRRHLTLHSEPSFSCSQCGKLFRTEQYLKSHSVIHSSRTFACSVCNVAFYRKDLLKRHCRIHQADCTLKCPLNKAGCTKTFCRQDLLKKHLKSHIKNSKIVKKKKAVKKPKSEKLSTLQVVVISLDGKE